VAKNVVVAVAKTSQGKNVSGEKVAASFKQTKTES
jgi:hypothetical protein